MPERSVGDMIAGWIERDRQKRYLLETQLEEAGVIAYAVTETSIVLVMSTGKTISVDGFFYTEGSFMEINGENLSTFTDI
jgi:hypothetical protein